MRQQFARFVLVGLATNAALYAAYLLLTRSLLHPKTAMTVVYVAGVGLGFLGNRYWSFRHSSPAWGSFARYLAACAVGYVVNLTGLYVGVDRLGLPQEWVQGLMVFVVADDHVPAAEIRRVCRVAAGRQPEQESDVIYRIPFNKPCVVGAEVAYVREVIAAGQMSGDGLFTKRCQQFIQRRFGAHKVLLTTSCTSALEIAALLCDLKDGDEVILPSYTFVSTANAIVLRGAKPVFVDIRADTLNLDERLLENVMTPRTRAIWPVHYAGVACDMDAIMAVAARHGLRVVEDAAQGVFASYKGRWLGTIGDLGCYSFHETKNVSCGEGGALLVNSQRFQERAEIIREKGTNRSQFLRGQVDKYTWVDLGSSYVLSDILAAFLFGQLERMEQITAKRGNIFKGYVRQLAPLAERGLIRLPIVPEYCATNYHMFYLLTANIEERTALIEHLKRAGILAVFHYVPLHTSPVGRSLGGRDGALPVTEEMSARLVRLPLYYEMTDADVADVVHEVHEFYRVAPHL